ncbi:hypothetical protein MNB_SV-5-149 [hydrothermal vent metagenome]|uniref:Uncharacterized protein n=1 Tax=hydrothermal vent metagenome TaxID=652676 RepID=A0A1W1ECI9_9ZZZZ
MEKMTIKAYAVKHKLSIFNVMKMVKSGKVQSEVFNENGREVTYILYDEESEKAIREQIVPVEDRKNSQIDQMLNELREEVKLLRKEVDILKKRVN